MPDLINYIETWINSSNDGIAALKILLVSLPFGLPIGVLLIKLHPDPAFKNCSIFEALCAVLLSYLCFIIPIGFISFFE